MCSRLMGMTVRARSHELKTKKGDSETLGPAFSVSALLVLMGIVRQHFTKSAPWYVCI